MKECFLCFSVIKIDIKMDWSTSNEILAVGGHKRINDTNYLNEIIFYTRRGEFLHRAHLPHTVCN